MAETVKVDLRNSVGFLGKLYGPGKGVEVPKKLADGLGLSAADSAEEQRDLPRSGPSAGTTTTATGEGTGTGDDDVSGTAEELDTQYSKAELQSAAAKRGLKVKRGDGGDGDVRKEDLIKALASDSTDADRASVNGADAE